MTLKPVGPRLERRDFYAHVPGVLPALLAAGEALKAAGLDPALIELVHLRVSQINSCAFCVAHHSAEARRLGVAERKLVMVAAWHHAPDFDATERAALAWAEAVTEIGVQDVDDSTHAAVEAVLGEATLARLTAAVALINAWNRIAATYRFAPAG